MQTQLRTLVATDLEAYDMKERNYRMTSFFASNDDVSSDILAENRCIGQQQHTDIAGESIFCLNHQS